MAARNLLHVTKVEAFKTWLIEQGHDCRDPVGHYQLLQIRLKDTTAWHAIYRREHMPEHVSVTKPLIPIVRQWLKLSTVSTKRLYHEAQRPCIPDQRA